MQNESSGVGGYETEICTNLRLLVMSGDKLHRQKESGSEDGGKDGEMVSEGESEGGGAGRWGITLL